MTLIFRTVEPEVSAAVGGAAQSRLTGNQTYLMGVAHDLLGALTVILGTAQLTERRMGAAPVSLDTILDALRDIGDAANRMTRQIAELEDFAMEGSDRTPTLERRPVDLVAMARETVARHATVSDCHRFSVSVRNAEGAALVGYWDAGRLARALDNLVGNAVKYSPSGGNIAINLWREAGRPRDGIEAEVAVLQVSDEGMGIPERDLPHIFECFRRAENVTNAIPGTGVGLSVVKQIIQLHGGTIDAASELGSGSTFTLRLPLPCLGPQAREPQVA